MFPFNTEEELVGRRASLSTGVPSIEHSAGSDQINPFLAAHATT
ncbi:hypothetical protein ABN028_00720 [Actinopolymorpha sp. B17G11]